MLGIASTQGNFVFIVQEGARLFLIKCNAVYFYV